MSITAREGFLQSPGQPSYTTPQALGTAIPPSEGELRRREAKNWATDSQLVRGRARLQPEVTWVPPWAGTTSGTTPSSLEHSPGPTCSLSTHLLDIQNKHVLGQASTAGLREPLEGKASSWVMGTGVPGGDDREQNWDREGTEPQRPGPAWCRAHEDGLWGLGEHWDITRWGRGAGRASVQVTL